MWVKPLFNCLTKQGSDVRTLSLPRPRSLLFPAFFPKSSPAFGNCGRVLTLSFLSVISPPAYTLLVSCQEKSTRKRIEPPRHQWHEGKKQVFFFFVIFVPSWFIFFPRSWFRCFAPEGQPFNNPAFQRWASRRPQPLPSREDWGQVSTCNISLLVMVCDDFSSPLVWRGRPSPCPSPLSIPVFRLRPALL